MVSPGCQRGADRSPRGSCCERSSRLSVTAPCGTSARGEGDALCHASVVAELCQVRSGSPEKWRGPGGVFPRPPFYHQPALKTGACSEGERNPARRPFLSRRCCPPPY